ncbi:multicopper oxidase domain-containing protein, partial [Salmonella sp. s54836]|uniref:multicopper oxidase domain-containing protein n=1 Tax=Salmonella sp. s54836 TaxID=3159673 RepID=UPI00397ECB14
SITQCAILPGTSFNYFFKASPSGSFWYHSHTGTQRTDGFFGSLIIRESSQNEAKVKQSLQNFAINDYLDIPSLHTASIVDWHPSISLQDFECVAAGLGFYPSFSLGDLPIPSAST